jgi:hypothetical protein
MRRYCLDALFLFRITLTLNSALLLWKPLVLEFLFGKSGNVLCSMFVLAVKFVPLLYALQLLMQFARTLAYLKSKSLLLLVVIFYN